MDPLLALLQNKNFLIRMHSYFRKFHRNPFTNLEITSWDSKICFKSEAFWIQDLGM